MEDKKLSTTEKNHTILGKEEYNQVRSHRLIYMLKQRYQHFQGNCVCCKSEKTKLQNVGGYKTTKLQDPFFQVRNKANPVNHRW